MTLSKILFSAIVPFFAATSDLAAADPDDEVDEPTRKRVKQTLINLPLRFEENTARYDEQVKYLAHGPGYTLFLTPTETVLSVRTIESSEVTARATKKGNISSAKTRGAIVRVRLEGANHAATLRGELKLAAPTNYFIGNDPAKWRTADNYERVRCESVYPGIDLLYHGKQRQLEYDFEVAPGANPKQIGLRYDGVRRLRVDSDGSLVLKLKNGGELRQGKPFAYQIIDGERRGGREPLCGEGEKTSRFPACRLRCVTTARD